MEGEENVNHRIKGKIMNIIIEDKLDNVSILYVKFAWLYKIHMGKLVISV